MYLLDVAPRRVGILEDDVLKLLRQSKQSQLSSTLSHLPDSSGKSLLLVGECLGVLEDLSSAEHENIRSVPVASQRAVDRFRSRVTWVSKERNAF